ncbi:WYL domain-containing protein [Maribacter arcticus]|nr:WYL domain-containing protein [Maribacter arcticus]MDA9089777.1 WYL domain-containing protein [Maribacter arcticus]
MANSKHAHLRYNILDECFRKRNYRFDELLNALNESLEIHYPNEGISIRTLREDLKVFRDKKNGFGAPLLDNARVLKYSNPNFSIAQRPLLEYEQYLIDAAQQLLERFENDPKYDKLAEALIKFQDEEDQQENDSSKILFYDHNDEYTGIGYLKPFYIGIKKKQVFQITFQGFNDKVPSTFEFHPNILKQYNRRWFVYGFNNSKKIIAWSIPLDERLISFNIVEEASYIESETNWEEFFRTMVGVRKQIGQITQKVVLRFYNGREGYFKTKPLVPDYDEFFEEEKKDQVWFETIINPELVQQLLSYGKDVEVLEPVNLKDLMLEHAKSMNRYYTT